MPVIQKNPVIVLGDAILAQADIYHRSTTDGQSPENAVYRAYNEFKAQYQSYVFLSPKITEKHKKDVRVILEAISPSDTTQNVLKFLEEARDYALFQQAKRTASYQYRFARDKLKIIKNIIPLCNDMLELRLSAIEKKLEACFTDSKSMSDYKHATECFINCNAALIKLGEKLADAKNAQNYVIIAYLDMALLVFENNASKRIPQHAYVESKYVIDWCVFSCQKCWFLFSACFKKSKTEKTPLNNTTTFKNASPVHYSPREDLTESFFRIN